MATVFLAEDLKHHRLVALKVLDSEIGVVKAPARTKSSAAAVRKLVVPEALAAALKKNRKAREAFEAFSPSHQREYAEWIAEAKGEDTRARRVATTVEWLTEGKSRNWKYVKA